MSPRRSKKLTLVDFLTIWIAVRTGLRTRADCGLDNSFEEGMLSFEVTGPVIPADLLPFTAWKGTVLIEGLAALVGLLC
jgi:hypothetical protein